MDLYWILLLLFVLGLAGRIALRKDRSGHIFFGVSLLAAAACWVRVFCFPFRDEGPGVWAFLVTAFALEALLGEVFALLGKKKTQ